MLIDTENSFQRYLQAESRMYRPANQRFVCKKRYMKLLKRGEDVGREGYKYFWYKKPKIHFYTITDYQDAILKTLEEKRSIILESFAAKEIYNGR